MVGKKGLGKYLPVFRNSSTRKSGNGKARNTPKATSGRSPVVRQSGQKQQLRSDGPVSMENPTVMNARTGAEGHTNRGNTT